MCKERQPTDHEAIRMLRDRGLAAALTSAAATYVMPICWIRAQDGRPLILGNGSAFLLDCGAGPFLVTAEHVYEEFLALREQYADTICILGNTRFDLQARHIASDCAFDVATFRVAGNELEALTQGSNPKSVLTGSQRSWPPNPPEVDRGVFFVGFPGDGRTMRPYRGGSIVEVDWVGYSALAIARGVSETDITLIFDHDHDVDIGLRPKAPSDWALGGCSGAPILTFVEHKNVFSWRLGGIIYESSNAILKASRADCLNPDGSINRYPNPMAYRSNRGSKCRRSLHFSRQLSTPPRRRGFGFIAIFPVPREPFSAAPRILRLPRLTLHVRHSVPGSGVARRDA